MKHSFSFLVATIIASISVAQTPLEVSSKIDAITVYPRGAQVERSATKSVTSGRQMFVFTGLASEMDAATINVSANSGITVLSVSNQVGKLKQSAKPKELRMLEDSLQTLQFDKTFNQNMLDVYAQEKAMVLNNNKVGWGGNSSDFLIEDLEDLSDFYRDRLADIMLKNMQLNQKQEVLQKNINRIAQKVNEANSKLNRATGEILVEAYVPNNATANFELSYMIRSAGWIPSYNINVKEVDEPLKVSYNAKVYQNTGVDWKDVSLTLTNANPNLSGNKPEIHPWRLYFVQGQGFDMGYSNKLETDASKPRLQSLAISDSENSVGSTAEYPMNDAVTEFKIKSKHSVPSNGKHQGLAIDEFTIPATYQYYCAPKLDPSAFLIARVTEFEKYDLLPGEANLFFSNTFVGKTYINTSTVADTLDLSLGRDQSIVVKREKIKEFCETKKLSGSTKETLGIEISVKNTKSTKIQLVIEDQVPISTDKEIEVDLIESKTALHDKGTGKLRWSKNIMAGQTESMVFKYTIKYPSDKKINL
jgi:uncharacterized protein (TIGR02231 family)